MRDALKTRLQPWLADRLNAPDLAVQVFEPLNGGSIQENWRLRCALSDGAVRELVLRKDSPAKIASSRTRREEYAIMEVAHKAGVLTPEPIGFCDDAGVIGAPFAVMAMVEGVGLGPRIAKDLSLGGDRAELAKRLGQELPKIQAVRPPQKPLAFLGQPPGDPALAEVSRLARSWMGSASRDPRSNGASDGRSCTRRLAPNQRSYTAISAPATIYMVNADGLTAVLDWEFAGWGDPMSDIGWFCAECWRFGKADLEAGGIAPRATLYEGYQAQSGVRIDEAAVRYWEVMAHLRWAVIALEQGHRHLSGQEHSLELALTGRIAPELERAVLRMTAPTAWRPANAR